MDILLELRRGRSYRTHDLILLVAEKWGSPEIQERQLWRHLAYLRDRGWVDRVNCEDGDRVALRSSETVYQVTRVGRVVRDWAVASGLLPGLGISWLPVHRRRRRRTGIRGRAG